MAARPRFPQLVSEGHGTERGHGCGVLVPLEFVRICRSRPNTLIVCIVSKIRIRIMFVVSCRLNYGSR